MLSKDELLKNYTVELGVGKRTDTDGGGYIKHPEGISSHIVEVPFIFNSTL